MKRELLSFAKKWNIPTIFVFTNTQEKAGDAFVKESQRIIDEEWGFKGFIKAYARVNSVIHVASGAAGLIPIPFSDAFAIAPIQAGMIYKMNDAFGMEMEESVAASLVTGLLGVTAIGQTAKIVVSDLIKFIPVVGAVISGTTAAAITEGIGFAYLKVLETCFNDNTAKSNCLQWIR